MSNVSFIKSSSKLHPKRRKRLIHYLLDQGVTLARSGDKDCMVIGGTAISIAGIQSIEQIPERFGLTFEQVKKYDLDFLKPIDASDEEVAAWKEKRRRDNAAERQRKHRAKYIDELVTRLDAKAEAEAKRDRDLTAEAAEKFGKLTPRAKEVLHIILDDRIMDAPAIAKVAGKRDAFNHRGKPGYATVAEPDREVRRALRILEKARFVTLADSYYWRQRTIRAIPTDLATAVPWRAKEPCHAMLQCPLSTEIIREIPLTRVTLSKGVTTDRTGSSKVTQLKPAKIGSGIGAEHPDHLVYVDNIPLKPAKQEVA